MSSWVYYEFGFTLANLQLYHGSLLKNWVSDIYSMLYLIRKHDQDLPSVFVHWPTHLLVLLFVTYIPLVLWGLFQDVFQQRRDIDATFLVFYLPLPWVLSIFSVISVVRSTQMLKELLFSHITHRVDVRCTRYIIWNFIPNIHFTSLFLCCCKCSTINFFEISDELKSRTIFRFLAHLINSS